MTYKQLFRILNKTEHAPSHVLLVLNIEAVEVDEVRGSAGGQQGGQPLVPGQQPGAEAGEGEVEHVLGEGGGVSRWRSGEAGVVAWDDHWTL